jgi:hypothetical protein
MSSLIGVKVNNVKVYDYYREKENERVRGIATFELYIHLNSKSQLAGK